MSEERDALQKLRDACVYRDAAVAVGTGEDQRNYALSQYVGAMLHAARVLQSAATYGTNVDGR